MAKNLLISDPQEAVTSDVLAQDAVVRQQIDAINDSASKSAPATIGLGLPDSIETPDSYKPAKPKTSTKAVRKGSLSPDSLMPYFNDAAKEYDVPVNVIMALSQQESSYNPMAVGQQTKWGKAKGLLQYLDMTAKEKGFDPFDPKQSIKAAAKDLRDRLDKGYSIEDAVKAHFAGDNRSYWGEKTAAYGKEVLSKAGDIADGLLAKRQSERPVESTKVKNEKVETAANPFNQKASNENVQDRTWSEAISDPILAGGQGVANVIGGAAWLANKLGIGDGQTARVFRNQAQEFENAKSAKTKQELQNVANAKGFTGKAKALATNPNALIDTIAQSAPIVLPGGVIGSAGARGAAAIAGLRGLAPEAAATLAERAAIAGGQAGEALTSGAIGGSNAEQQVLNTPIEELRANSPEFNQLSKQYGDDQAKAILAKTVGEQSALLQGGATLAGGVIAGKANRALKLGDTYAHLAGGNAGKGLIRDVSGEVVEEATQSPLEQIGSNIAQQRADQRVNTLDNVPESIAEGVAGAIGQSAGMKAPNASIRTARASIDTAKGAVGVLGRALRRGSPEAVVNEAPVVESQPTEVPQEITSTQQDLPIPQDETNPQADLTQRLEQAVSEGRATEIQDEVQPDSVDVVSQSNQPLDTKPADQIESNSIDSQSEPEYYENKVSRNIRLGNKGVTKLNFQNEDEATFFDMASGLHANKLTGESGNWPEQWRDRIAKDSGVSAKQVEDAAARYRKSVLEGVKQSEGDFNVPSNDFLRLTGQEAASKPKQKKAVKQDNIKSSEVPSEHSDKWFSTQGKAQAYIDKKGIGQDFEAVKTGKVRFEVKPKVIEQSKVAELTGEKINDEWTTFSKDSGTLNVSRSEMPQVDAGHRGALVNYLSARGIDHKQEDVEASSLKPTQREYSPAKVQKAKEYQGGERSILISSDNHVLDGHHQWLSKLDGNEKVKVIRLNAPIKTLLNDIKEFPSVTSEANHDTRRGNRSSRGDNKKLSNQENGRADEKGTGKESRRNSSSNVSQEVDSGTRAEARRAKQGNDTKESNREQSGETKLRASVSDAKPKQGSLNLEEQSNSIRSKSGKPFASKGVAAIQAKKNPGYEPVQVDGGWELRSKNKSVNKEKEESSNKYPKLTEEELLAKGDGIYGSNSPQTRARLNAMIGNPEIPVVKARADSLNEDGQADTYTIGKKPNWVRDSNGFSARQYVIEYSDSKGLYKPVMEIMSPSGSILTMSLNRNGSGYFEGEFSSRDPFSGKPFEEFDKIFNGRKNTDNISSENKYSIGSEGNASSFNEALLNGDLGESIGKLIDDGLVIIHDKQEELPDDLQASATINAVTDKQGKIHLVAENLSSDTAQAVLLHEMFHAGANRLIGQKEWQNLLGRLESLYKQAKQSQGAANTLYQKALDRIKKAKDSGTLSQENEVEEFGAYIIEEYEKAPTAYKTWASDTIGKVKAYILNRFGKQLGEVTPAQLRHLAAEAVRQSSSRAGLQLEEQSVLKKLQQSIQDQYSRFKEIQEAMEKQKGKSIESYANFYDAAIRMPGRIAARLDTFRNEMINPIIEELPKINRTMEDLSGLLHALHAKERNKQIATIKQEDGSFVEDGSGMSDKEADEILDKYKGDRRLNELAEEVQAIAKQTLKMKHDYGLIDKETYDHLSSFYTNYVPLKGNYSSSSKIRRALGHSKRDEKILENIARDFEQAVSAGERNMAYQYLMSLFLDANDSSVGTVNVLPKRKMLVDDNGYKVFDNNGNDVGGQVFRTIGDADIFASTYAVEKGISDETLDITDFSGKKVKSVTKPLQANEIKVYVDGRETRLQLNDPVLVKVLRGTSNNNDLVQAIIGGLRAFNRFLSAAYTGYNPTFILKNAFRDASTGSINLLGNYGVKITAQAWKNYPSAIKTMHQFAKGELIADPVMKRYLTEYRMNGGKTGASHISDIERQGKSLTQAFEDAYGARKLAKDGKVTKAVRVASRKAIGKMAHFVEVYNQATENALRLSTFIALRENGASTGEAAIAAKNVTVDFDRKGTATGALGALYLFFNPAIQGTANSLKTLAKGENKEQAWSALAGLATLGYFAASVGMDDDKDRWLGQEWSTRSKSFVLNLGSHSLNLPMSQEYVPFYAVGVAISEAMRGEKASTTSLRMLETISEMALPFRGLYREESEEHGTDLILSLLPTTARIGFDLALNRTSFGTERVPETDNTKDTPDNLKMYRTTKGSVFDAAAQGIAKAGELAGNTHYENDLTKLSPETLKYLWATLTGGLGSFITDNVSAASLAIQAPDELDTNNIPFLKDFVKQNNVKPIRNRFNELKRQADEATNEFKLAKKNDDIESLDKLDKDAEKTTLESYSNMITSIKKEANALRDEQIEINADNTMTPAQKLKKIKELEKQEEETYREALRIFK